MILLDTHTWLWWASGSPEISPAACKLIDNAMADAAIAISCISSWEIAMLVSRNRLQLSVDADKWIQTFEGIGGISFIPVTNSIGLRAVSLPGLFHADPADRIIVATAIILDATLVTRDARIRAYAHVRSAW
jgi:PIN domain nuclease of toxin-antitoxin system